MYTYETDEHLKRIAIAAVKAEKTTGYPPVGLLAQWAVESSWGQKVTGDFNFWGIKCEPDRGSSAKFCSTFEDLTTVAFQQMRADERASVTKTERTGTPGITRYHLSCWFASYASYEESVAGYIAFILGNSRYHAAWAQYQLAKDYAGLLSGIARAGYATGGGYEHLLLTIAGQQNIHHAVFMASKDVAVEVL